MNMPGFGIHSAGSPLWWVSKWKKVMRSRIGPLNSGITSHTRVVSANWPSSMARRVSTVVKALVSENNENTESSSSLRA